MASHRPYRRARALDKAIEEISEKQGVIRSRVDRRLSQAVGGDTDLVWKYFGEGKFVRPGLVMELYPN